MRQALVIGLCVGLHAVLALCVLAILGSVVPPFEAMFADFGTALPWPTDLVLRLSRNLRTTWWLLPPAALLGLALDVGLLWLAGRWKGSIACLGLGALIAGAQLLAGLLIVAALYLPIFALAEAVR